MVFLKQKMIQQLLYDLPSVSLIFWTKSAIKFTFFRDAIWHKWPRFLRVSKEKLISSPKSDRQFFLKLFFRVPFYRNHFKRKNMWGYGINFWNGSFKQNLTKERKQPSRGPILDRWKVRGSDALLKVPFLKKNLFLNINETYKK